MLTIYQPDGISDDSYDYYIISYTYSDDDTDGTITFYYDPQPDRNNSTPAGSFAGVIGTKSYTKTPGGWANGSYVWNVASVPQGSYYIYGRMTDGTNTTTTRSLGYMTVTEMSPEANIEILEASVTEDGGDGDGIPESGEPVSVKIRFRNNSAKILKDITGTIIDNLPNTIQINDGEIYFGDLGIGQTKEYTAYADDFDLVVLPGSYHGVASFSIRFVYHEEGGDWIQDYEIFSFFSAADGNTEPSFEISSITVQEDDDADGIIESGEDIKFHVNLRNWGNAKAINVSGQFDPLSSLPAGCEGIDLRNDTESFPDLNPDQTGQSTYTFRLYDVPKSCSGIINANLKVTYGEDGAFSDSNNPYAITIQPTPYLYLSPSKYDFGMKKPQEGPVDVPLTITNRGTATLSIQSITVSNPEDTQIIGSAVSIEPGSSSTVTVRIDISGMDNQEVTRTVTVHSDNAHEPKSIPLAITGYVDDLKEPSLLLSQPGYMPDIYDYYIVWSTGGKIKIKYIVTGKTETISMTGKYFSDPKIHEYDGKHLVVFEETTNDDIWLYEIETQDLRPVCTAAGEQREPQIWDRYVVWRDKRNGGTLSGGADLYGFDLQTNSEFAVAIAPAGDDYFDFALNGTTVVWHKQRIISDIGHHYILSKTLPNGSIYQKELVDYPKLINNISFFGTKLIYDGAPCQYCSDDQLWAYDVVSHSITQLTSFEDDHVNPDIWDCRVVYEDRRFPRRAIYEIDICNPNGENPVAVDPVNSLSEPVVWKDFVAWESGDGNVYAISLSGKDISAYIQCPDSNVHEDDSVPLLATIYNVGSVGLSDIPVKFYLGDPLAGGVQIGETQYVSIAPDQSATASINWTALSPGIYDVYLQVELGDDFTETKKSCQVEVLDNDQSPPKILDVSTEEYSGDGDGFLDTGEQVKISWSSEDAESGICNVSCFVNGLEQIVHDNSYVIVNAFESEGTFEYTITAEDCASPPNRGSLSNSFSIHVQPKVSSASISSNSTDVPVTKAIEIVFNIEIEESTVNAQSLVLEEVVSGSAVESTVTYNAELKTAYLTPAKLLDSDKQYRIRVISGPTAIQSKNSGWWSGGDHVILFTTVADNDPPTTLVSSPSYSKENQIMITWSAEDDISGVRNTSLCYKKLNPQSFWITASLNGMNSPFPFTDLSVDGDYYFTGVSTDLAGKQEDGPPSSVDHEKVTHTILDREKPSSQASAPDAVNDLSKTFEIGYTSYDATSGVAKVELWVKPPGATEYLLTATDNEGSIDGQFQFTVTDEGAYRFYTRATDKAGNIEELPATGFDAQTIYSSQFAGYALLAVGSISGQEGLEAHTITANNVYQHLVNRNFTLVDDPTDPMDHIKYFNPYAAEPITGKDDYTVNPDNPEGPPIGYKLAMEKAVTQWATTKMNILAGPLYIILIDHGTPDAFSLTATSYFTSQELNGWLNILEAGLPENYEYPIVLILGTCYSGSFIDNLSKPGRIIITSTAENEPSYRGPLTPTGVRDGEFFVSSFFNEMGRGFDVKTSYERAVQKIEAFTYSGLTNSPAPYFDTALQHPFLDDNGDGKGSHELDPAGDGAAAKNLSLGYGTAAPAPVIVSAVGKIPSTPLNTASALVWAEVNDRDRTDNVWVEIRAPNVTLTGGEQQQVIDLPKVDLTWNAQESRYEATYNNFNLPGRYALFFYARDTSGIISSYTTAYVYREAAGNTAPEDFDLLYPGNGSSINAGPGLGFAWESPHDPDGDPVTYTLEIGTDIGTLFYREEGLTENIWFSGPGINFTDGQSYQWKVTAVDWYGNERSTVSWAFTVNNQNDPEGWIKGLVYNAVTLQPVLNVQMNSTTINIAAFGEGAYFGTGPTGTHSIDISADGYESMNVSDVTISDEGLTVKDFGLTPTVTKGSINGDNTVDLADAILASQLLVGMEPSVPVFKQADVNEDEKIGLEEMIYILQAVSGLR